MAYYLIDAETLETVRQATIGEYARSITAKFGCILVDGKRCFVDELRIASTNCDASIKLQSVESTKPGFVMPANWHWRLVDANNGRDHKVYGFRLIGWNPSDNATHPYCVTDVPGHALWVEHIRFVDGDTCDWSDDDTVEPC